MFYLIFRLWCLLCLVHYLFVISTSAIDCLRNDLLLLGTCIAGAVGAVFTHLLSSLDADVKLLLSQCYGLNVLLLLNISIDELTDQLFLICFKPYFDSAALICVIPSLSSVCRLA